MSVPFDIQAFLADIFDRHHLSCRIAFASPNQIAVMFYTSVGAQNILTETANVYGIAFSGDLATAIKEAAHNAEKAMTTERRLGVKHAP